MKLENKYFLGFSLIELMIVVSIVGILAAIGYPSYLESVRSAHRMDAMNNLLRYQLEQEKHRASNATYAPNFVTLIGASSDPINSTDGYYSIAISGTNSTTFVITAAPTTKGGQDTDRCNNFRVDQNGPVFSGTNIATAQCWNQ